MDLAAGGLRRPVLRGALTGLAFGLLETLVVHLPALHGTDVPFRPLMPATASLAYAAGGALLGAVHPLLVPLALAAVGWWAMKGPKAIALRGAFALAAGLLGALGVRFPRATLAVVAGLVLVPLFTRTPAPRAGSPAQPDVVVVVLDTVAARRTSLYGAPLPTTPYLERLAAESTVFDQAIAPAPWTVPSHAALFTGRSPREVGAHQEHPALSEGPETTAEALAAMGWRTGAFAANPWVRRETGLTRGFQHEEPQAVRTAANRAFAAFHALATVPGKGGRIVVASALDWLDQGGEVRQADRFGVAHPRRVGRRSHKAIMKGPSMRDYPRPGEAAAAERLQAAGIRFDDGLVEELVEGLRARGRLDRTILVVTADHGESFGMHGTFGHLLDVYEELVHVPLLVRWPAAFPPGTREPRVVSLQQVHPTLLELATGEPRADSLLHLPDGPGTAISEQFRPDVLFNAEHWGAQAGSPWDRRAARVQRGKLALVRTMPVAGEAQCGSSARWDLCGGPPVTGVPTAKILPTSAPETPEQRSDSEG